MNDFFTKLARRVLNPAPLVRPVIPPRFVSEISGLEQSQLNLEGQTGLVIPEKQTKPLQAEQHYNVSSPVELPGIDKHVNTFHNISLTGPRWQTDPNVAPTTGPNLEVNPSEQISVEEPQYVNNADNKYYTTATQDPASGYYENDKNDKNYRNYRNDRNDRNDVDTRNQGDFRHYQAAVLNSQSDLVQSNSLVEDKTLVSELSEPFHRINSSKDTRDQPEYLLQNEPAKLERRGVILEADTEIPTVRVSVGRIEVRAIVPPAPPQPNTKVERKNPALTLNDYLKQRDGGKR